MRSHKEIQRQIDRCNERIFASENSFAPKDSAESIVGRMFDESIRDILLWCLEDSEME